jgi:hypothetical protein
MQLINLVEIPAMGVGEARDIVGSLSNTSKMPCYSWGLDARECKRGSVLRRIQGTSCSICYAHKGNYSRPNVRKTLQRRLEGLSHPRWKEAMVVLITHCTTIGVPYFRWFDTGDVQSYEHLLDILWIAKQLPMVKFWMPTSERRLLKRLSQEGPPIPSNLVIRYSSPMIDRASTAWGHTSMVVTDDSWTCQAPLQNNKCEDCRACWSSNVTQIRYKRH